MKNFIAKLNAPLSVLGLTLFVSVSAWAKLPPLSDEAKSKAAEAAAKAAHGGQVANFQLCKSMDAVAGAYFAKAKQSGKAVKDATATAPCAEPAPFVYPPPAPAAAPGAPAAPAGAATAPGAAAAAKPAVATATAAPAAPAPVKK